MAIFIFHLFSLIKCTQSNLRTITNTKLSIQELLNSLMDIRFFTTSLCILSILFILSRSYVAFKADSTVCALNPKTNRGILLGPIFLILFKYTLFIVFYYQPNVVFCNVLEFTPRFYILFGILDLICFVLFLKFTCIGSLARFIMDTLPFFYILTLRVMIAFELVKYFFPGFLLDVIYISYMIAMMCKEKDRLVEYVTRFWTYLNKKIDENIERAANENL